MQQLMETYQALDVKNVKTELAIVPVDFKGEADDNGVFCAVRG